MDRRTSKAGTAVTSKAIMLPNLNTPDATRPVTTADEVLERPCPSCDTPVRVTIPAGSLIAAARFVRGLRAECDTCSERREAKLTAEADERSRNQRAERSNLPKPLRGLSWDSYRTDDPRWPNAANALLAARAWADGTASRRGLWVAGPVGVGKTRLAVTAAWEMLLRRDVRYVNVPDLITMLSASFGDKDRALALKVLTGRGALVLDDMDKIPPSTNVLAHLYTAVNSRYDSGAPVFITTNLEPAQLRDFLAGKQEDAQRITTAESIVSRLLEMCNVGTVKGPDRRRG